MTVEEAEAIILAMDPNSLDEFTPEENAAQDFLLNLCMRGAYDVERFVQLAWRYQGEING